MKKPRLASIEYIRGIAMLGVIGIHAGSAYSEIPAANMHIVAVMEIMTRFSVPIFFFISAFGLFYNLDLREKFQYSNFLRRRFRVVLIPYLFWSFFYLLQNSIFHHTPFPDAITIVYNLFFGTAKYHIYFLVILLWFYIGMPLWIWIVKNSGRISLLCLFLLQIAFNYISSTILWNIQPENPLLNDLLTYRLNYWVLHYLFIFLLGGWLATHLTSFRMFLRKHWPALCLFFSCTLLLMLFSYYQAILQDGLTAAEAADTVHQLTPAGIFYTLAASLFFFGLFSSQQHYPACLNPLLSLLGHHSYFIYLAHPLMINIFDFSLQRAGISLTAPLAFIFYTLIVASTVLLAIWVRYLGRQLPVINLLTIGSRH